MVGADFAMGLRIALMLCASAYAWQARANPKPQALPVFRVFGTEQGLPSRQVNALAQDQDGRLWIGTANGLVRFDGHQFLSYPARLEQSNALASTSVEALTISTDGQVWVATQGGHLARWRAATNDFQRVDLHAVLQTEQLELWSLAAVDERIWVGSYGAGLLELSSTGSLIEQHRVPARFGSADLIDVLPAAGGGLWLTTLDQRLLLYDGRGGFSALVDGQATPPQVYGMTGKGDKLWFSTRDGRSCQVNKTLIAQCVPMALLALPARARMLQSGPRGDWVGGLGELLRSVGNQAQRIGFTPGRIGGVPQQALLSALTDTDQGLWFGSGGGGLLYLPPDADRFQSWQPTLVGAEGLRDGRVRGVARDSKGRVWIGTMNGGLHRLTPSSGLIEALELPGTQQRRVWAVLAYADNELWIGHQDGVLRVAVDASGRLKSLAQWPASALVGGIVDLLQVDGAGQVWAASMGDGLNRIDPLTGKVAKYPFGANGLVGTEVQQIAVGLDQRVWVATDRALLAFDSGCECWQALIGSARIDAFTVDDAQRIYAFVDGQLARYDWREGLFRDASFAPRAFAEFQTVGAMAHVGDGLWLVGPQGLYRYQPASRQLDAYDSRDGLPTQEFSDRPLHLDADGRLWIGSEDGLLSLDPREAIIQPPTTRLRFDQLIIDDGRLLDPTKSGEMGADERELSVAVRLATLARPHAQRFSFKLQGWDQDWSLPSARPERRLGTLPPGQYTLEVRAWDGYGQTAVNQLSWSLRVLPPWWRSSWAHWAYLLIALMLLAAAHAWRLRRIRAAQMLEQVRLQAQWAERLASEKTALVAELSHEIRNPLNGVLGMGRLLADQPLPLAAQRYLALLTDAGKQLARLLDDMLDWSRLEARAAPLPKEIVALRSTLAPTIERYTQLAMERNLQFETRLDAHAVLADAPRLLQIVENLLSNAFKFTASGKVSISAAEQGERVELWVRDSGPGLTAAQIARLFQPFERVGNERAAPGTGLGLAISRSLAERMGGALRVESEIGVGSCFMLLLDRAEQASTQSPQLVSEPELPAPVELSKVQLLVVEDDPVGREVLEAELTAAGIQVHAVADALSALIAVQEQDFDAALLDWDLDGMSGLDLARTLRAQRPELPLIAVTGRATPADRALAVEIGFIAHLAKPVNPRQLLATLRGVLRSS